MLQRWATPRGSDRRWTQVSGDGGAAQSVGGRRQETGPTATWVSPDSLASSADEGADCGAVAMMLLIFLVRAHLANHPSVVKVHSY